MRPLAQVKTSVDDVARDSWHPLVSTFKNYGTSLQISLPPEAAGHTYRFKVAAMNYTTSAENGAPPRMPRTAASQASSHRMPSMEPKPPGCMPSSSTSTGTALVGSGHLL